MRVGADSDWISAAKDYVHSQGQTKSDQSGCSLPEQLNCPRTHLIHGSKLLIQRTAPCELFNSNEVLAIESYLSPCLIDHRYQFVGGVDNTSICSLGFGNVMLGSICEGGVIVASMSRMRCSQTFQVVRE